MWKRSERHHSKVTRKKKLLISILPFKVMEHLLKSAAMRSDVEGSYEELEKELLEYLASIDQQNRKAIWEPQLRGRQYGSQRPRGAN